MPVRRISQVLLQRLEMLVPNFAGLLKLLMKSENVKGTGDRRSRLFMVRRGYSDTLKSEPDEECK